MFIEKIIISGFRSFNHCEIDNISPGQNVFVGLNGSGKSNIILALDFVLTKNHYRLNQTQKNMLICQHQSTGKKLQIIEASVEIYFNNQDGHFPLKEEKIIIKREITNTYDHYYINHKQAKFEEMVTFLESGGFSLDNSYYLVKQGLIPEIAMSNPLYILNILRSISGAKSFDEKKIKSMELNDESQQIINKIENTISLIENNLSLININEDMVRKYEKLLKTKKYVVVQIKKCELRQLKSNLKEIEEECQQITEEMNNVHTNFIDVKNNLKDKQSEQERIQNKIDNLQDKFDSSKSLMETLLKELSALKEQKLSNIDDNMPYYDLSQIDSLEKQLEENNEGLKNDQSKLSELIETEKHYEQQLKEKENKRANYYNLINIVKSTQSMEERDKLIKEKYLDVLYSQIEETKSVILKNRQNLEELKLKKNNIAISVKNSVKEIRSKLDKIKPLKKEITDLICQNKLNKISKKEIMNQLNLLQKEFIIVENDLKEVENWLNLHTSEMAIASKRSIETILKSFREKLSIPELSEKERERMNKIINGYYGQLIDCFELTKPIYYAVEALMRNTLFYHIVADETIAVDLLDEMSKRDFTGSFKFLAVNRSQIKNYSIEDGLENLYQNLLNCIKNLKPNMIEVEFALQILFNGLFIGRSFDACWKLFQKSQNCDFSTLEGEMIDRAGVITKISAGRPTKLEMYQQWTHYCKRYEEIKQQIKHLEAERDKIMNENLNSQRKITLKRNELATLQEWFQLQEQKNDCQSESLLLKQLDILEEQINLTRTSLYNNETRMTCLIDDKQFWQQQLGQILESEAQQIFIEDLTKQIDLLKRELYNIIKQRTNKEYEIQSSKTMIYEMKEKLTKMKYFLSNQSSKEDCAKVSELEIKLNHQIELLRKSMSNLNSELTLLIQTKYQVENQLESLKEEYNQIFNKYDFIKKRLQTKKDEYENINSQIIKIRLEIEQTGVFSNDFLNQLENPYRNLENLYQMNRALKDLNRKIKCSDQGGNVNKETLRCYRELRQQIEKLVKAKERQVVHLAKVRNLIQLIEHKKNDIVIRTYKQVNMHFQKIFQKFVPNGCACLQFLVSSKLNDSISSDSQQLLDKIDEKVDQFEGIEILVSFTSNNQPDSDLTSLSTGQKALVSLVFIFALQQVDPMPFYIFDEVDQSLDQSSRDLIAEMIYKQKLDQKKQFIITTFHKELVQQTDRVFLVKNTNGLSQVKHVTRKNAIEFLTKIPQEKTDESSKKLPTESLDETPKESPDEVPNEFQEETPSESLDEPTDELEF